MNRENLTKLAEYLESLPANYEHFDMALFYHKPGLGAIEDELEYAKDPTQLHTCGTVACALGHGPAAGISPENCLGGTFGIDWTSYGRLFVDLDNESEIDDFLFSGEWSAIDNSLRGAAARIRYVLDNNNTYVPSEAHWDPALYAEYLVP